MLRWWKTAGFGRLEAEVMEIMWQHTEGSATEVSVTDVAGRLKRALAYTTVMTTLDRLFKKGVLNRRKSDRAFLYCARISRRQWEQKRAGDFVAEFLAAPKASGRLLASCLVEAVGDRDRALLDELEHSIREKRRELERRKKP
jgi:predicted transcriptional regulator